MLRFECNAEARKRVIVIVGTNVVMILFAIGIASGILPPRTFRGAVIVLHKMIGITLPTADKERTVAVIWIASLVVITDGILLMMVLLASVVFKA